MMRITNEQREAVVRAAFAKRDELLADCAGGMPCTTCPDKKTCGKTGCVRQPEYVGQTQDAKDARIEAAFDEGWKMCADWAIRDDLLADMPSHAYKDGRERRIAAILASEKGGAA